MELHCYNITSGAVYLRAVGATPIEAIEYADRFLRATGVEKPLMAVEYAGCAWHKATPGCTPFRRLTRNMDIASSPFYHPGHSALGTGGR